MKYQFIDDITDRKIFLKQDADPVTRILAENNNDQFLNMHEFFMYEKFLLLISGFLGTGKSSVINYFTDFLRPETIVLMYNCYETSNLEDLLLALFEKFKTLEAENIIREPKMRSENFAQKINSYFISISAPIVVIIDSFEQVLKSNKGEILDFLKHLSHTQKVKVVIAGRTFDMKDFEKQFDYSKIIIGALEKHNFEKYLKLYDIKTIGPVSDELYKHTRGYFLYVTLAMKIIQIRGLSMYEFLDGYSKSFLSYNDFILREALALIDPVSGHLFRFLTIIRHPVSVSLLRTLNLYDDFKIKVFIETCILAQDGDAIYLKDYYKIIAENSIPDNVAVKIHKSCVDLYNTQLPLKPMERNLLISRATMRAEIEYHTMFLPKKPVIKPKYIIENGLRIDQPQEVPLPEPEQKDIKNISFIFDSEEEETSIMNQIADSINEFITFTDEQLKAIEKENSMTLVELINLARQQENKYNFKRVVMIYQRILMMKNDANYIKFLPVVYARLGMAYSKLSDWFNSLKYYEEALKIYVSGADTLKAADIKLEMANVYYQMFKREDARNVLTELTSEDNLTADIYIKSYIKLADISDDDFEKAYEYMKKALNFTENSEDEVLLAELYYKLGILSEDADEVKQAVMCYKNCVELAEGKNQFASGAYSNLAAIYEDSEAKESAEKFYEKSLALDEESGNDNGIYNSSMKLAALNRKKNPEKALHYYEQACSKACRLNERIYKVSSSMAFGDFYNLYMKNPEAALEKYLIARTASEGKLGEKNMAKINKRIDDVRVILGDEKFNEIQNRFNNEAEQR